MWTVWTLLGAPARTAVAPQAAAARAPPSTRCLGLRYLEHRVLSKHSKHAERLKGHSLRVLCCRVKPAGRSCKLLMKCDTSSVCSYNLPSLSQQAQRLYHARVGVCGRRPHQPIYWHLCPTGQRQQGPVTTPPATGTVLVPSNSHHTAAQ